MPLLYVQKPFAELAHASGKDVDKAVQAASQCFHDTDWSTPNSALQRAKILQEMGAAIRDRSEVLSIIETMDNGKPFGESEADIGKVNILVTLCTRVHPHARFIFH